MNFQCTSASQTLAPQLGVHIAKRALPEQILSGAPGSPKKGLQIQKVCIQTKINA